MASTGERTSNLPFQIDVTFSRSNYRLGAPIVGTIRVHSSTGSTELLKSLQLTAVGFRRLDPRWHRSSGAAKQLEGFPDDFVLPPHTVPFWTTGSIELLHLPERTYGTWEEIRPTKPIHLLLKNNPSGTRAISVQPKKNDAMNDPGHLLFTFRVLLPSPSTETPHTFHGTSCRYDYCILLRILTESTSHPEWLIRPVTVLPAHPEDPSLVETSPLLQAMAHATGLSTRISASALQAFEGQYTVQPCGGSETLYRNARHSQSRFILDPLSQCPVALLSIGGSPADLHPGSRISFTLDFFVHKEEEAADWIPVYQVSAGLLGEERVPPRTARRYIWSTAHEMVDPSVTECVSLSLIVPESVPCTIQTPHVELNVQCLLDITVGARSALGKMEYRNIHLEIPCQVRPGRWEGLDDENDAALDAALPELYESIQVLQEGRCGHDAVSPEFSTKGIEKDLQRLSIHMAKVCGLQPQPTSEN